MLRTRLHEMQQLPSAHHQCVRVWMPTAVLLLIMMSFIAPATGGGGERARAAFTFRFIFVPCVVKWPGNARVRVRARE